MWVLKGLMAQSHWTSSKNVPARSEKNMYNQSSKNVPARSEKTMYNQSNVVRYTPRPESEICGLKTENWGTSACL